ncbi:hypothetical protein JCM10450v2_003808 [Rhodotorula kratochvilovae]
MSSANSTSLFPGFPPPPEGANPYAFYLAVLVDSLSRKGGKGFDARQSVLCVLSAYVVCIAVANLVLVVRDGRRRGKKLFLWRRVARERGRYIVGNRQILEPILTLLTMPFLIAHVINEWQTTFGSGYAKSTGLLRLMPWTFLFVQLWIVSWASLQSYVITASESNRLVADVLGTRASVELGIAMDDVRALLAAAASFWPRDVPPEIIHEIRREWGRVAELNNDTLLANRGAMATFVAAPFLTAVVNAGCLALLLIVHRQIRENYSTFAPLQLSSFTPVFPIKSEDAPHHVIECEATDCPTLAASGHPAVPPPSAGVALSITPATPLHPDAAAFSSIALSSASQAPLSTPVHPPSPTSSSRSSTSKDKALRPTRSVIRRLADRDDGGIVAVQARNLQILQRAEMDLFITGISGIAMTVSFSCLALWTLLTLTARSKDDSPGGEIVLLLGSWLYTVIQSCSLTAHFRSMQLNAQRPAAGGGVPDARGPGSSSARSRAGTATPSSTSAGPGSTRTGFTRGGSLAYMPTLESERAGEEDASERRKELGSVDPSWLSPADAAARSPTKEEEEDTHARDVIIELGEVEEPPSSPLERVTSITPL